MQQSSKIPIQLHSHIKQQSKNLLIQLATHYLRTPGINESNLLRTRCQLNSFIEGKKLSQFGYTIKEMYTFYYFRLLENKKN